MIDEKIVDMYWARSEEAIEETSKKYGGFCHSIAYNILRNMEDSAECVNDTYLKAWNSMPTNRPTKLGAFLGKITRNLAINKYKYYSAKKRGGFQIELALEELSECVSGRETVESVMDDIILRELLNKFLGEMNDKNRDIFVSRYWYLLSVKEIAKKYDLTESNVKTSLHRSRIALRDMLVKEGIEV